MNFITPVLTEEESITSKNIAVSWVQKWLNLNAGYTLTVDGVWGTASRAAFISAMTCTDAPAITDAELKNLSIELGDNDVIRIKAVAAVESAGSGWFNSGLPKILYERHKFWNKTSLVNRVASWFANPKSGDYTMDANNNGVNDSWEKLSLAIGKDPLSALCSVSIGKFQVMGEYYLKCGYKHPIEMLYACSRSELAQYNLLRDYILEVANIRTAFLNLNVNPTANIPFASAYNGSGFRKNNYHVKLAEAMAKEIKNAN